MRHGCLALSVLLGACSSSPSAPVGPLWQQHVLGAQSLDIGWSGVEGEAPRKVLTGSELVSLKRFFAKPLTDAQMKCLVHIDASIRAPETPEVFLCFGCGTVVVDRREWNRVEREQMRILFTQLLGPRPKEAELPPY